MLDNYWSPALNIFAILYSIYELMTNPNIDDCINNEIEEIYKWGISPIKIHFLHTWNQNDYDFGCQCSCLLLAFNKCLQLNFIDIEEYKNYLYLK